MPHLRPNNKVQGILRTAKWDPYMIYRGQSYYPHLIREFYANMDVSHRVDGIYIESFANDKNVYI